MTFVRLIIFAILQFMPYQIPLSGTLDNYTMARATRTLTTEEKETLGNILNQLLEEDLLNFFFKYQQLQAACKKLQHIHGVQLLHELCTTHNALLQEIKTKPAQWRLLSLWVHKQLSQEAQRNDLLPHLHLLEKTANLPQGTLQPLVQENKYVNMLELLLEKTTQLQI